MTPHPRPRVGAPLGALALGAFVVAALAASVGVDVRTVTLDEHLHKLQAVRYTDGLPGTFLHDPFARSTARLYSLVIMPAFALFDGDVAVRVAKAINALLFASAALPAYLVAREARLPRRLAVLAGVLSVAVPWLTITTVLYTENLAYPLFVWAVWAIVRAVRAPAPGRDALALALIALCTLTRTQLAALFVGYALLAAVAVLRARAPSVATTARRALRAFPFTAALAAVSVFGLALVAAGALGPQVDRALGPYRGIPERDGAPADVSLALVVEMGALALGVGVVPAVLAALWFAHVLRRPLSPAWWPALAATVLLAVLWATTLVAQGGYLGPATEERYFFYAAPLLWIGALGALHEHAVARRPVVLGLGGLAALFAALPLVVGINAETEFLSPVLAAVGNVTARLSGPAGLSQHDVLVALALLLTAVAALAWRSTAGRWAIAVAVPVILQLALTAYVFGAMRGGVPGVPPRTGDDFAALGWVDRAVDDGTEVSYVRSAADPGRELALPFWNDGVISVVDAPELQLPLPPYPISLLPAGAPSVAPDATVSGTRLADAVVQEPGSPFLQLAGQRLATEPSGALELVALAPQPRARWSAQGLDGDGVVSRPVRFVATPPVAQRPFAVTLELAPLPGAPTSVIVRFGGRSRTVALSGAPRRVRFVGCGPVSGAIVPRATLPLPDGRSAAADLVAVTVEPGSAGCPAPEPGGQ